VVAPGRKRSRSSSSDSSSSSTQPRKKRKAERKAAEKRKAAEPEITPEELAKQKAAEEKKQKLADKEAAKTAKKQVEEDKKKARIAEAAFQKEMKQTKAMAGKMAMKLTPAIRNLQGALADPNIQHVPAFTLVSAKASLVSCPEVFEGMSGKKGEDKPAELSVDIDDVETLHRVAMQDAKDVNESLAPVLKFRNRGAEKE
jgi:hypothetical protein